MPKLWSETIDEHRHAVREASLNATAALIERRGLRSVTMSQIAHETGIGRATLYKYFPDVDAVLLAWHERQINAHLAELRGIRDRPGGAWDRLRAVLEAYALIVLQAHGHAPADLAAILHQNGRAVGAHGELSEMVAGLLADGVVAGNVRSDVPADELASYCLHSLAAAGSLHSKVAARRLVAVTLAGVDATA